MAARAYGDANENPDFDNNLIDQRCQRPNGSGQQGQSSRRSTKHSGGPGASNLPQQQPHHGYVFKEFTRDSMLTIERRRTSKAKKNSATYFDPARSEPEPDPYLASGQQLPPALVRQLPGELIGKPIEELDPYYGDKGTFVIISRGKELTRFSSAKALYLLGPFHPIRRIALYILVNPIFNLLVILTILINCILMTLKGHDEEEKTEIFFTIVYTTEMCLKVLARGFIVDEFTYLRDPWNWLDFTVIIMAYLTIVIEDLGNLSVMRTFRVLRALKTVAIIPGMKTIVGAVIDSVKNLKDVVVLTLFSLSVFSLLGLQIYMGILTQKCILNGPTNMTDLEWFEWSSNSSHWIPEADDEIFGQFRLCGNATGAQTCPEDHTCLQGFGGNPDYGYTNFDTFGWSLICSFRLMTQDFWEGLYAQILKTAGSWHILFFIVSMFLGSIYLMNLILAIVAMSYNELQRRAEEEEEAAAEDEAAFLESCRMMEMQEQMSDYSSSTQGGGRTSYRPSVEIGLVGQSLLASLCQNGLLGNHVREKLNQQMILPGVGTTIQQTSNRSHSLCVNLETSNARRPDEQQSTSGTGQLSCTMQHRSSCVPMTATASSMMELRRKSSLAKPFQARLANPSNRSSQHLDQNLSIPARRAQLRKLSSPHHKSNGLAQGPPASKQLQQEQQQVPGESRGTDRNSVSARSSTTSDRDLQFLRQRAALIRIVSDDYSDPAKVDKTTTDGMTPNVILFPQNQAVGSATGSIDFHLNQSHVDENNGDRRISLTSTRTNTAESCSHHHLSVNPQPEVLKTRPQSVDYRSSARGASLFRQGAVEARASFASDVAICQQPRSIHSPVDNCQLRGRNKSFSTAISNSSSVETSSEQQQASLLAPRASVSSGRGIQSFAVGATGRTLMGGSTKTLHSVAKRNSLRANQRDSGDQPASMLRSVGNIKQLGLAHDRYSLMPQQESRMHHLSVENFQQFGVIKSSSSLTRMGSIRHQPAGLPVQRVSMDSSGGEASETSEYSTAEPLGQPRFGRGRLESRAYIHPSTMMRSSFARPRHSIISNRLPGMSSQFEGDNGTQGGQLSSGSARRVSQDFVRRASDWSRLSMSGNVDLRRLLRLWMHTNPYQGRPSVSSFHSHYSGANYQPEGGYSADGSPTNSVVNPGSPRPSSVGSTRQAYELISAYNRRHNGSRWNPQMTAGYEGLMGKYSLPLDDNMNDKISITGRDKCIAYCLSCLDVLCIWECCGAWLKIQKLISIIVFDPFTELFIILCILINTLFMALDSNDADASMKTIFERGNYFFTATFAVEASMKIIALSPKFYFREGWNVFDCIIVGLSLLELGLEGVYGLSVLRSFRLLRVFKLAKSWPTLNLLISIMGKAVGDLGNLTFVLGIIVFIFAVMGMQLFGNKYVAQNFPSKELPRWNFNDFMHSFMIVFRILCAEWIEPMWDCLLVGSWPCIPFFLIAVTVGNLVVLNLFLALLLASFGSSNLSSPQTDNVDTRKLQEAIARFSRFGRWIKWKFTYLLRTYLFFCSGEGGDTGSGAGVPGSGLARGSDGNYINSVQNYEGPANRRVKGSHIAAMSKLERLKNIEARTEELKSKIKRSPEHHYHLRQLAQSQLKESSRSNSYQSLEDNELPKIGYNYHYKHRRPIVNSASQMPIGPIPIIVNDVDLPAVSCPTESESPENQWPPEGSLSESFVDVSYETGELGQSNNSSDINHARFREALVGSHQQQPNPNNTNNNGRFSALNNMQPIREDSRDAESTTSLSEQVEPLEPAGRRGLTWRGGSLDKLAQEEASLKAAKGSNITLPVSANYDLAVYQREAESEVTEALLSITKIEDVRETGKESNYGENDTTTRKQSEDGEEPPEEQENVPKGSMYLRAPKREDMEEEDEKALQHIETYIENCICMGIVCLKWFLFRQHVRRIVEHRYFDQCILVLIVISSGTLALEDKHLNERPNLKWTLDVLDTIFTVIFSLEMLFKWLAFGIRRYFGNIWSWLDFLIVLVSFVNLMASIFGSGKIQALKTMRTLRAMRGLRPLRALQRFQGMRVVVNALIQAIPSIFNVLLVCLIFWLIFSIMGVQMFGGKFWRCLEPFTNRVVTFEEAGNKQECLERNLTWANPQINFDNVLNAYLALFQVATFKGWIDIMNSATDSRNRDDQPIREANIYMYLYFVFFVIFGSFFTLNLFIGVIIDNFNEQKKKTGGSLEIFMTDDQKKYYHAMKKMRSKRPQKAMTRPKLKIQAYMFDITTSKKFDMTIMLIIGLNMFVMALEHYNQSLEFSIILENLNLLFIAIFTLECLCKIFAMRHFYFREPWNVFDFIVVNISILGVVMKEYVAKYFVSPTLLRVVRVVKVGRVLRLVKGAKGIRTLLFALAMSLPALFNICLLLFLVMFIYAIFGMSFFMNVRKRNGLDEIFNFETFTSSIIVLFQMSTSAAWDIVLDPLMDEENDCQKPEPALGIEGTCGNRGLAICYLISYVIITYLIIINMYIAVILENYSQATEDVQQGLTEDDYEMYYEIWQKFDPDGTQYLAYERLSDFVDALEDPLRIPKPNGLALVILDINIYEGNRCYCVDILDALTKYFFTRKGLVIQVNEHLQKVQSTLHETSFERITTTYLLKREHYCARLIQNTWRKWRQRTAQQHLSEPDSSIVSKGEIESEISEDRINSR